MIVKLPGSRNLPVDAKAPLSAYLDAEAALDDASRRIALDRHAQQLSRHVMHLSGREYGEGFETAPEMVVLFLPGDHFLSAALERDPELLDRALAQGKIASFGVSNATIGDLKAVLSLTVGGLRLDLRLGRRRGLAEQSDRAHPRELRFEPDGPDG